jgi:hypothetical protein
MSYESDEPEADTGGCAPGHHHRHRRYRHRRKERVLHTRVSDGLADDIRRLADDLRVPASNLVRNVLEEVFAVVEAMSDDVGGLFEDVLDEAEAARERLARARRRREHRAGDAGDVAAWRAARAEVDEAERGAAAAPPPPPATWHFAAAGRSVGPCGREELRAAVRDGRLGPDTLVWSPGMPDWRRAAEVAELVWLFAPPPLPDAAAGGDA